MWGTLKLLPFNYKVEVIIVRNCDSDKLNDFSFIHHARSSFLAALTSLIVTLPIRLIDQ